MEKKWYVQLENTFLLNHPQKRKKKWYEEMVCVWMKRGITLKASDNSDKILISHHWREDKDLEIFEIKVQV